MAYPTDPVARWCPSLDTAGRFTTTLNDLTGNGNNGTLTNMDPATDWVLDGGKYALDFDGYDDFVSTAAPGIVTTSFGLGVWFRTSRSYASGNFGVIVRWGTASTYPADIGKDFVVLIGSDSNFGSSAFGVSQYGDPVGVSGFNDGIWHHGYIAKSGSSYLVWVDGVLRAGKTTTTNTTAGTISIGTSYGYYYQDLLDDIQLFNRALSDTEISDLYTAGRGYQPNRSTFLMGNPL